MTERVLTLLGRNSRTISCIFDGKLFNDLDPAKIETMLNQVQNFGSIRIAKAFFERRLSQANHKLLLKKGISPIIVSSDKDVYMALEAVDSIYHEPKDILVLGVLDENLLPVLIFAREKIEVCIITENENQVRSFIPYSDHTIILTRL